MSTGTFDVSKSQKSLLLTVLKIVPQAFALGLVLFCSLVNDFPTFLSFAILFIFGVAHFQGANVKPSFWWISIRLNFSLISASLSSLFAFASLAPSALLLLFFNMYLC